MKMTFRFLLLAMLVAGFHQFGSAGCGSGSNNGQDFALTVTVEGQGTVSSSPAGIDCGNECDASFASGTEVTLSADPAQGYRFTGWDGGGCSGTESCTVTLDADAEVTATFEILQIVFSSDAALDGSQNRNDNGVSNIWLVNADGTDRHPLTNYTGTDISNYHPRWSPDGTKILFNSTVSLDASNVALDATNVWAMGADGSNPQPLTQYTATDVDAGRAEWSPDGTQVVFESSAALNGDDALNANFTRNIWVMDADGGNPTPLTDLTADNADAFGPQWAPNGQQIAYASTRALNGSDAANTNEVSNLWVISSNGSNDAAITEMTGLNVSNRDPQWSPDSSTIAFDSTRNLNAAIDDANATNNIWTIGPDGSNPTALTQISVAGASNFEPQWSTDGTKITFASQASLDGNNAPNTNSTFNIWIMDANGQNRAHLTAYTVLNLETFDSVFSPDNSQVLYSSEAAFDGSNAPNDQSSFNLFLINTDGTGLTALTQIVADKTSSGEGRFLP